MASRTTHRLIQDSDVLHAVCNDLSSHAILAIDTEFVRESTYYPQFCLLQIASPSETYCIDPLSMSASDLLRSLLSNDGITFLLHSARQDLELLWQQLGVLPSKILDSQIAAGLAGFHEQIGYAPLIDTLLGITLSKEQTRTDWSRRPLTADQLHYAADDVTYLIQAYAPLQERLSRLERMDWWQEDSSSLLTPSLYETSNEDAWRKVKGLLDLEPRALARGIQIAHWREEAAKSLDRPRTWILRDETLVIWAEHMNIPASGYRMREVSQRDQALQFQRLHETVASPPPLELSERISLLARSKMDPNRKAMLKSLTRVVHDIAATLELTPSVLASRKDLESFIDHPERSSLAQGWRKDILNQALLEKLRKT